MKKLITATLLGLALFTAAAQNTYNTNGLATVPLATGNYRLAAGANETGWSLDGAAFSTNWSGVVFVMTNVWVQGVAGNPVTLTATPQPYNLGVVFATPNTIQAIQPQRVSAAMVDGAILLIQTNFGVSAATQLSSKNLRKIVFINNDDDTWVISCTPK